MTLQRIGQPSGRGIALEVGELGCDSKLVAGPLALSPLAPDTHLASLTGYSTNVRPSALAMKIPSDTRNLLPPSCSLRDCTNHDTNVKKTPRTQEAGGRAGGGRGTLVGMQ